MKRIGFDLPDFDLVKDVPIRQLIIEKLESEPSTSGAFEVNNDILLARMQADLPNLKADPNLRKLILNGEIDRDLLIRNLYNDPKLPSQHKI